MKNILFIGILALCFGCNSSKSPAKPAKENTVTAPPPPALDPREHKRYAAIAKDYFDRTLRNQFNGSILIAKNGVVVYEKYAGYKDFRAKDSLTAETPLQIASTSKTLTSAAVLMLVQQGKLSLDAPVYQFFPGFPYPDVTVKMLLSHRSGLPEYLYFFEKNGWDRNKFATNDDVINALITWQPGRASNVDRRFDYCNTNFVLLASIVEKVSGVPFPEFMKKNIFEPLQMNNTYVFTINDTGRSTQSYDWRNSKWQMDFSDGTYGDKNVYSTPRDLLKWDQALYSGKIISKELQDLAYTPLSNERRTLHNYGLGWRLLVYPNGKKVVYHNGRWHGFNSAFGRLTDEKVTIIMLTNKFNRNVYTIARKMYNNFGDYASNSIHDVE